MYVVDFTPHGLFGPFTTKPEARQWAATHGAGIAPDVRMCVIRTVLAPRTEEDQ